MISSSQTVNEYLENSEKLINHAEEMMEEEPEKALALAAEQFENHVKLLQRGQYD